MYLSSEVDLSEGQIYCLGTYDTLSKIGRKSANLSAQGVVEWRLIVQRTQVCEGQCYDSTISIVM